MKKLNTPADIALTLRSVVDKQKKIKETLKPLEEQEDKLREAMIQSLNENHLSSASIDNYIYTRETKTTFRVLDENKALEFAKEKNCLKIDMPAINSILLHTISPVDGFEQKDTPFLSIRKNGNGE